MNTTETAPLKPNPNTVYTEPTHDEIALAAFLQWEREGRQPGRELEYWLRAESQLRALRQKKAEAAAQSAPAWPRPSRTAQIKKATVTVARKLTTAVTRSTTPAATKNGVTKTVALKSAESKPRARRTA
jgi:hypothetical protein